jgi:hypothetical protein
LTPSEIAWLKGERQVSKGYWVILPPLSAGQEHVINFGGEIHTEVDGEPFDIDTDTTCVITVGK